MVVLICGTYLPISQASAASLNDAATPIVLGLYTGTIMNEGDSLWFDINLTHGIYDILLNGPDDSDFDLYIYKEQTVIDKSNTIYYPEKIVFLCPLSQTLLIEVRSVNGVGDFTIEVSETLVSELIEGNNAGEITNENSRVVFLINASVGMLQFVLEYEHTIDMILYSDQFVEIGTTVDTSLREINYYSDFNSTIYLEVFGDEDIATFDIVYTFTVLDIIELGKYTTTLAIDENKFLAFPAAIETYNFTIITENGEFDMVLYDSNFNHIDSTSFGQSHPGTILYDSALIQTLILKLETIMPGTVILDTSSFNYPRLELGETVDTVENGESNIYEIELNIGDYIFTITENVTSEVGITLYNTSFNQLAISEGGSFGYPAIIDYASQKDQKVYVEVYIYSFIDDSAIQFSLHISLITNDPVPDDFNHIENSLGFDIYEISGVLDEVVEILLQMRGEIFYVTLTDTLVYPLVDDVVYDETNNRNPHRLASSEDSYLLFYGNHSMNYTSAFDELFLIVYSTDSISHGYDPFEFESGYKLTCNFEMEMVNTTNDYSQSFAFTHTGKIYNNQDEYWDDGEFHIYIGFKLEAGEVLDVVMHADAWISVVFFDGDNVEDIKITENKITHYSKWRGEFPVYNYDLGSGNFGISYKAPTSMSVNIAIYEYLYPADEFSYTFYSNINYTGGINNIGEIRDEFTEEAFIPWFFKNTLFGLISIYIISIKSKKLD